MLPSGFCNVAHNCISISHFHTPRALANLNPFPFMQLRTPPGEGGTTSPLWCLSRWHPTDYTSFAEEYPEEDF